MSINQNDKKHLFGILLAIVFISCFSLALKWETERSDSPVNVSQAKYDSLLFDLKAAIAKRDSIIPGRDTIIYRYNQITEKSQEYYYLTDTTRKIKLCDSLLIAYDEELMYLLEVDSIWRVQDSDQKKMIRMQDSTNRLLFAENAMLRDSVKIYEKKFKRWRTVAITSLAKDAVLIAITKKPRN